jgi:hypothetical protein
LSLSVFVAADHLAIVAGLQGQISTSGAVTMLFSDVQLPFGPLAVLMRTSEIRLQFLTSVVPCKPLRNCTAPEGKAPEFSTLRLLRSPARKVTVVLAPYSQPEMPRCFFKPGLNDDVEPGARGHRPGLVLMRPRTAIQSPI